MHCIFSFGARFVYKPSDWLYVSAHTRTSITLQSNSSTFRDNRAGKAPRYTIILRSTSHSWLVVLPPLHLVDLPCAFRDVLCLRYGCW